MGKRSRWWGALLIFLLVGQSMFLAASATEPRSAGTQALLPVILQDAEPELPLVLVHGWQGGNVGLPCRRHDAAYVDGVWGNLDEYLGEGFTVEEPAGSGHVVHHAGLGFHVEMARLYSGGALSATDPSDPNWHCTPVVEENVPHLMEAIDAAKAATGRARVILVGHSMGGLVSRAYLESSSYREDVAMLITMGTPHIGVPVDVLQEWVSFLTLGTITLDEYCQAQPAVCQFADDESDPDYPAGYTGIETFNAIYQTRAPGVRYHLLGGDAGFFDRNPFGNAMDAILTGPDDGIVPLVSAVGQSSMDGRLPPLSGPIDRQFLTPTLHTENFTDEPDCVPPDSPQRAYTFKGQDEWVDPCFGDDYVNRYIPPASFLTCLALQLGSATADLTCGEVGDLASAPAVSPPWARLPGHRGAVGAGAATSHALPLGNGPAMVAVHGGPAGDAATSLEVSLRDPAGRPVTARAGIRVTTTPTGTVFRLEAPRPGQYRLTVAATGGPARYVTTAAQESALRLEWAADRSAYIDGDRALITATLSAPIRSAHLTGTLRLDGREREVRFTPAGSGRFTAALSLPDTPGTARLTLRASGITPDGLPFARERVTILPLAASGVALSGAPTAAVVPSTAGAYADVAVTIPISATTARTVRVAGVVTDAAGEPLATAIGERTLSPGEESVALSFSGRALERGAGPLHLARVWILDEAGRVLDSAASLLAWTPGPLRRETPPPLAPVSSVQTGPEISCVAEPAGPHAPGDTVHLSVTARSEQRLDYVLVDAPPGWTPSGPSAPPPDGTGWVRPTAAALCPGGQSFWGVAEPSLAPLSGICDLRAEQLPPTGSLHAPWAATGIGTALTQGFETAWPPAGWHAYITAGDPNEGFQPTTDAFSGAGAVRHAPQDVCLLCTNPRSWLVSPALRVRAGDDLVFWQKVDFPNRYGTRAIYVSVGSPDPGAGDFQLLTELGPATVDGWHQIRVDLDDYATRSDVHVAFYYEGDDADLWTIDDVRQERPTLAPVEHTFSVTYQVPPDAQTCGNGQAVIENPIVAIARDDRLLPGTASTTCIPAQCAATADR